MSESTTIGRSVGRIVASGLTALGIAASGSGAHAVTMTFTDQTAWEAALSGASFLTENFDGAASTFAPDSVGNPAGLVTIDLGGDDAGANTGLTGTGMFEGLVEDSSREDVDLVFNRAGMLGVAFLGFAPHPDDGDLDTEELGLDFGAGGAVIGFEFLACEVAGLCTAVAGTDVPDTRVVDPIPFLGFVFDGPLDFFRIDHGDDIRNLEVEGDNELFLLDGLIIAEARAVSEPAPLLLLAMGLIVVRATRNRRAAGREPKVRTRRELA